MNKKGQALVEFVLILPVMIIILLCIVDFGNIISNKYSLESDLDNLVDLYQFKQDKINDYVNSHNEEVEFKDDGDYVEIKLKKIVRVNTPILNNIMGSNYEIIVSRNILKEVNNETES